MEAGFSKYTNFCSSERFKISIICIYVGLELWNLTPLSIIFHLYRGGAKCVCYMYGIYYVDTYNLHKPRVMGDADTVIFG